MTIQQWIRHLNLTPHQEGGFYKRLYTNEEVINLTNGQQRALSSSILFLLTAQNPSRFHRLNSDEIWYYHHGQPLTIHMLLKDGQYKTITLGLKVDDYLQYTVPKGTIFAATVDSQNIQDFTIVSCMVSPAFDYQDFELLTQQQLLIDYPQYSSIIKKLAFDSLP